jgi:spore maturation protein CgeB
VHHAFDPDLHRPVAASLADVQRYGCDVSFIGTWSPKKERILRELHSRLPALHMRIWGEQWTTSKRRRGLEGIVEGRAVEGEEYVRAIVSSKINLGILSEERAGSSAGDQITSRTFHIPACGGFMLHERTAEVREVLHEPSQVACFSGMDELVMQVSALLEDDAERAAIAARGRERIGSSHSWDHRIREIVAVVDR